MSKAYRVAILGLGVIGQRMLTNMPAQGRLEVIGGFDTDPAVAERARQAFDWLELASDPQALIGQADVVYIGTPPRAHAPYVRLAAQMGKAVFCEKPLGVELRESAELCALVDDAGILAAINLSLAGASGVADMRAALREGTLGKVAGADIRLRFATWPRGWQANASWLANRDQGGFVREVATHFIWLAHSLLGPARLTAHTKHYPDDESGAELHCLAAFDCGGTPVTLAGSVGGAGPDLVEFTLWGSERSLRLTDFYRPWVSEGGAWQSTCAEDANPSLEAYMRQLDDLVRMLDGAPHGLPTFREALHVQEHVEAILA